MNRGQGCRYELHSLLRWVLDNKWSKVSSFIIKSVGVVFSVRDSAILFSTMNISDIISLICHSVIYPYTIMLHSAQIRAPSVENIFIDFSLIWVIVSLGTPSFVVFHYIESTQKDENTVYGRYNIAKSVHMSFTWLHSSQ